MPQPNLATQYMQLVTVAIELKVDNVRLQAEVDKIHALVDGLKRDQPALASLVDQLAESRVLANRFEEKFLSMMAERDSIGAKYEAAIAKQTAMPRASVEWESAAMSFLQDDSYFVEWGGTAAQWLVEVRNRCGKLAAAAQTAEASLAILRNEVSDAKEAFRQDGYNETEGRLLSYVSQVRAHHAFHHEREETLIANERHARVMCDEQRDLRHRDRKDWQRELETANCATSIAESRVALVEEELARVKLELEQATPADDEVGVVFPVAVLADVTKALHEIADRMQQTTKRTAARNTELEELLKNAPTGEVLASGRCILGEDCLERYWDDTMGRALTGPVFYSEVCDCCGGEADRVSRNPMGGTNFTSNGGCTKCKGYKRVRKGL